MSIANMLSGRLDGGAKARLLFAANGESDYELGSVTEAGSATLERVADAAYRGAYGWRRSGDGSSSAYSVYDTGISVALGQWVFMRTKARLVSYDATGCIIAHAQPELNRYEIFFADSTTLSMRSGTVVGRMNFTVQTGRWYDAIYGQRRGTSGQAIGILTDLATGGVQMEHLTGLNNSGYLDDTIRFNVSNSLDGNDSTVFDIDNARLALDAIPRP